MTGFRMSRRGALLAAAGSLALGRARARSAYPDRPVRLVVGYSAGGAVDIVARTLGQSLSAAMGQPFIVENRPGAGTNIAVKSVIAAAPDGYTLMLAANALAANMALYKPMPFDAERDLALIAQVGRVPVVIAANASAPWDTLAQLVAAVKARPGSVAYATPGNGSTPHMAVELFARTAGIDLRHVPYRGGAQAITDTIGGQVPLVAVNALEALPHVRSGKLRIIAALSADRARVFPDAPTIAESGYPGFEASVWYGLVAPAATPALIVERLHAEVQKALATPEVRERLSAVGGDVTPGGGGRFATLVRAERQRYDMLVREAGITPD